MAILFEIEHVTTYKYKNPVTFGTHRAMFFAKACRARTASKLVSKDQPCFQDPLG
jgi:hypothetical protein